MPFTNHDVFTLTHLNDCVFLPACSSTQNLQINSHLVDRSPRSRPEMLHPSHVLRNSNLCSRMPVVFCRNNYPPDCHGVCPDHSSAWH
ncbi:hypothetical protein M378DRAFT_528929 [Amanita muscaria Koide BX008]|uniref:Uncharacterized protein n=1 Tax=Amanita muscaria (strain Koide BX008) TaxID=946122 RepID=A0A0C2X9H1_AMAMK|nr:hypothetical protein M378DRAFT_528929 [Amanita muscaria Koide BX008]